MKKKQVIVVKKIDKLSPKKEVYISRRAVNSDSIENDEWKESFVGNPAPQRPTRDARENILTRSILGDPKVFESFVDMEEDTPPSPVVPVKRSLKHSDTTASTGSNYVSNKKKSVLIQPPMKLDPKTQPHLYLESLQKLKMKASKLREKEIDKETKLIQYLPVNERFDLNKEGKVLAMWQERQRKWNNIQKSLAKRVGGTTESLMMNTGDEFRARNEEYDVLQAAIPVHERFGAETWKMMLRDGTERSVTIGHVFSGLSCPVSIKTIIPATIRKPRQVSGGLGSSSARKNNNTFIDPTPSLLKRQKQLQKTLQTIRPHSLGPAEVEGFVIASQNLFDWAIQSSEKYFSEKQHASAAARATAIGSNKINPKVVKIMTPADEKLQLQNAISSSSSSSYGGPQITFLSSRNILLSSLQGETVHQTVTFRNTGPSAMTFIWKSIPERELHEPSDVALVMAQRDLQPRAHVLSKERSPFFCSHPIGQILPGDTVETVFSFCSKGSGGNFVETWILDTLPRAVVFYPPLSSATASSAAASGASSSASTSIPLPSTVYIKLKGHSYSLDETQYRRSHVTALIEKGTHLGNMRDATYLMLRRVRKPVTRLELNQRKLNLFKEINQQLLISVSVSVSLSERQRQQNVSSLFALKDEIKLTMSRLEEFVNFRSEVIQFSSKLFQQFHDTLQLLRDSEAPPAASALQIPGLSRTNFQEISCFSVPELSLQKNIRQALFPEKTIEIFDEVTEEMVSSEWNYDLQELQEFIQQLIQTAMQIQSFEQLISKNQRLIEKARVTAERKAQDSDYEEEEEEDEDEDGEGEGEAADGEEKKIKPKSLLVQHVESFDFHFKQLIFIFVVNPLPENYSCLLASPLAESFEEFDSFKATSLETAGLKGDLIISPIQSPFLTQEGQETWQTILAMRQPLATGAGGGGGGKKAPAGGAKPQKGYASEEQRKKYYLSLYELISNALMEGILNGVMAVDHMMSEMSQRNQDKTTTTTSNSTNSSSSDNKAHSNLHLISAFRPEDLSPPQALSSSPPPPIFFSFNGDAFGSLAGKGSAFDIQNSMKLEFISSLLPLIESGAETIVLLFESTSGLTSGAEVANEMTSMLSQQWNEIIVPKIRRQKKQNKDPTMPPMVSIETKFIPTMAELNFSLARDQDRTQDRELAAAERRVRIFLLENLLSSSLVPKTPAYVEEMSDDEEDAIPIGLTEFKESKVKAWQSLEPRDLPVTLPIVETEGEAALGGAGEGPQTVNCLTNGAAALARLVSTCQGIFIEGDIRSLFPLPSLSPNGILSNWNSSKPCVSALVSDRVRETMVWLEIVLQFPFLSSLRSETNNTELETFADYLSFLFPLLPSASQPTPTLVISIGGQLTTEKFRFLESVIDLGNTIILTGEFSLPFLLATGIKFIERSQRKYVGYKTICGTLIAKARLRGVTLVLPTDLTVGDELITSEQMNKSSTVIDKDARDEGGDYEGEATVVSCDAEGEAIAGYPFDLGPVSCQTIRSLIPQHSLHLSWGTAGCCEISAFQAGQRAVVESSIPKSNSASAPPSSRSSPRNIIIGEANVEWWSRICDSDGEFDGNLVKKGDADLVCRSSSTFTSVISHLPSQQISNILRRAPNLDEWDYLSAVRKEEEEEEEDDEEEEEED